MLQRLILVLALVGCAVEADSATDTGIRLDLSERLGDDEVRAGQVSQGAELFGGISAEGAPGDFKLYNDRVRFIIEAVGDSNYYMDYGGTLIDADLVRPEGEPGRDLLDELAPMVSLARIVDATSVTVIEDGSSGVATIRVEGRGAPLRLATGAVENEGLVPDVPLRIVTDYTLLPGEYSLTATTTVYNEDTKDFAATIGLFGIVAQEVASFWRPGTGFDDPDSRDHAMQALFGNHNEAAIALMAAEGLLSSNVLGDVVSGLAAGVTAFGDTQMIAPGASGAWTARIGVGPDLATLETERLLRDGLPTNVLQGTVTTPDGKPIAGARVTPLNAAGEPITVAVTDSAGNWTSPSAGATAYLATGRGTGQIIDLPAGFGNVSPYDRSDDDVIDSLQGGSTLAAFAEGYGVAQAPIPTLSLTAPGTLVVRIADGGPAMVEVDFVAADSVAADDRLYPGRPDGHLMVGYVRDGEIELPVEPGEYRLTASRGIRYEVATGTVTVGSGESATMDLDILAAYSLDGVLAGDPHMHASPSGDGGVSMESRLVGAAANGIQVHFGTDHDHVADYNPALAAMGLTEWMKTVVAVEVSPVLRGHFNSYPARQTGAANGSAPRWWQGVESTASLFADIRKILDPAGIIQANHPVSSSGLFRSAEYSPVAGTIGDANRWSADFDAMELLNSNDYAETFPYYADLISRGQLVTPVGVSDSHTITSGDPGLNLTFLHTGGDLASFDNDALTAAFKARATVVSHGPYIDATLNDVWAPGSVVSGGTLAIRVLAPSWLPVESVHLWRDGTDIAQSPCIGAAPLWCETSFELPTDADASYVVTAESATPMTQVWPGQLGWAATSAVLVDVAGDGWTPPKPALIVE